MQVSEYVLSNLIKQFSQEKSSDGEYIMIQSISGMFEFHVAYVGNLWFVLSIERNV